MRAAPRFWLSDFDADALLEGFGTRWLYQPIPCRGGVAAGLHIAPVGAFRDPYPATRAAAAGGAYVLDWRETCGPVWRWLEPLPIDRPEVPRYALESQLQLIRDQLGEGWEKWDVPCVGGPLDGTSGSVGAALPATPDAFPPERPAYVLWLGYPEEDRRFVDATTWQYVPEVAP